MSDDLIREARKRFTAALEFDRENREAARDDLDAIKGKHWTDEELRQREEDGRPSLTLNRLPQSVRQVTGDLRLNTPSIKVRPVDGEGDVEIAKIYSGTIRNIEDRSKLRKPYVTAGISAARCGIGHFRVKTDYLHARTFDQDIHLEPIHNPFAVVWDPLSRESTRADARYCFVIDRITREEFKAKYPTAQVVSFEEGDAESDASQWFDADHVQVAEYWQKEPIQLELARMPEGDVLVLDDLDEENRDAARGFALEIRKIETHKVTVTIISGLEVLEEAEEWLTPDFPIIAVSGEEIVSDDDVAREGVIRHAKDAQRMYNYWNTAQAEFIALQPKQPYIAEIDQIAPYAKDWKDANRANKPVLPYKSVPGAPPPQRQSPAVASPGMVTAMMQAAEDIKACTGIYDAALGNRSNETSGVAIEARQQESDVSTFFVADNLAAAIQQAGRVIVDLIPRIYDTQRVLRILNEDDSEEFVEVNVPDMTEGAPLKNDLSIGRYDVSVSTGASFSTRRSESVRGMAELMRANPEIGGAIADLFVGNMDWPGADEIAKRLRKMLPAELQEVDEDEEISPEEMQRRQAQAQAGQMQQAQAMLEMEELKAKVAKLQTEAEQNRVETAEKQYELAVQTGQLEQVVRQQVAAELTVLLGQQPTAPTPGIGV